MTAEIFPFETRSTEFESNGEKYELTGRDGEYIHSKIVAEGGFYEHDLLDALSYLVLPDGAIVDVGAHIGNHSVFFGRVLERPVIAVEPHPANFRLLMHNLRVNDIESSTALNIAFGAEPGTVTLKRRIDGNDGTFYVASSMSEDGEDVPLQTLDSAVGTSAISLIKIDTEGYEIEVLRGSAETLSRYRPMLAIEIHSGRSYRDVVDLLSRYGYKSCSIHGLSDNYIFAANNADDVHRALALRSVRTEHRAVASGFDRITRQLTTSTHLIREYAESARSLRIDRAEVAALTSEITLLRQEEVRLQGELARAQEDLAASRRARDAWQYEYARVRRSRALIAARKLRIAMHKLGLAPPPPRLPGPESLARSINKEADKPVGTRRRYAPSRIRQPASFSSARVFSDPIRVGLATVPERQEGLKKVVDSLYEQVDEICVYLNRYDRLPSFLKRPKITAYTGPDVGDRGKFFFIDGYSGYYLTVDDDIHYPPFYVGYSLDAVERYHRQAVVGWHGAIIQSPFEDYYDANSRRTLSYRFQRDQDIGVHVLGTGTVAMHTDTMNVSFADFKSPNVADVYFALLGQAQETPFVVLSHQAGWATAIGMEGDRAIWIDSMENVPGTLNTRARATELVKQQDTWGVHRPLDEPSVRSKVDITFVGRTDPEVWKKGGILKSSRLTRDMLGQLGLSVNLVELSHTPRTEFKSLSGPPQVTIVYPGDPDRPDFDYVHDAVAHHAERGDVVLVNLSYTGREDREMNIRANLRKWNERHPGRVYALVFSDRIRSSVFADIAEQVISLPKTIEHQAYPRSNFDETDGVFLGDYAKLCNDSLFDYPVEEWLESLRRALPGIPLYTVRQYQPSKEKQLPVEILPYLETSYYDELARFRLMVSLCHYCTFEMVPIEMAAMGVPVVYRMMDQSLSEYLGMSGVEIANPIDLEEVAPTLYYDRGLWERVSLSAYLRSASYSSDLMSATLYFRLLAIARRHGIPLRL